MGIESRTPPTNVAVTSVGEPVARGSLPSAVTNARFTVASRWIDISGLSSVGSGLDYSPLKRVCYLFGPIDRAKGVTSRESWSHDPAGALHVGTEFFLRVYCRDRARYAGPFRILLRRRRFARSFFG